MREMKEPAEPPGFHVLTLRPAAAHRTAAGRSGGGGYGGGGSGGGAIGGVQSPWPEALAIAAAGPGAGGAATPPRRTVAHAPLPPPRTVSLLPVEKRTVATQTTTGSMRAQSPPAAAESWLSSYRHDLDDDAARQQWQRHSRRQKLGVTTMSRTMPPAAPVADGYDRNSTVRSGGIPHAIGGHNKRGSGGDEKGDDAGAGDIRAGGSSDAEIKAALRKVDLRIMPFLSVCYINAYLNRTNMANARVVGNNAMEKELNLQESDMQLAISVFFLGYVLLKLPSNLIMRRASPRAWLALLLVSWGCVCSALGAVTGAAGLHALRAVLGAAQAGFVPGILLYLTFWYRPGERAWRVGVFLSAAPVASPLVDAAAAAALDGAGGLAAWRWIFIVEGIPTVACGIICYFYLPNYPEECKFLTPRERKLMARRLRSTDSMLLEDHGESKAGKVCKNIDVSKSAGVAKETLNRSSSGGSGSIGAEVLRTLREPIVYLFCVANLCILTPLLGFTYSFPVILRGLGFRGLPVLLMGVPVYAAAAVTCLAVSWAADRARSRSAAVLAMCAGAALGLAGLWLLPSPPLKYAAAFLVPSCLQAAQAPTLAWITAAVAPQGPTAVAVASALAVSLGNVGGLVAAYLFPRNDAPDFAMGNGICIALVAGCAASIIALRRRLRHLGGPI